MATPFAPGIAVTKDVNDGVDDLEYVDGSGTTTW